MVAHNRGALERRLEPREARAGTIYNAISTSLLAAGAGFMVAILLTSIISRAIVRHAAWKNFCVSWIVFALTFLILVPFGYQSGPQPPFGLCLTQSILVYLAPTLAVCSTFSLVLQLLFALKHAVGSPIPHWIQNRGFTLLIVPYIIFVIFLIFPTVYGLDHRDSILRSGVGIYCVTTNRSIGRPSAVFVTAVIALSIGMEGLIVRLLYRNWSSLRGVGGRPLVSTIFRVALFTFAAIFALGLSLLYVADGSHALPSLLLSSLPLIAAVIVGTQKDMFSVWLCMRSTTNNASL